MSTQAENNPRLSARAFQIRQAKYWRECLMRATGLTLEEALERARRDQ